MNKLSKELTPVFLIFFALFIITSCHSSKQKKEVNEGPAVLSKPAPKIEYGINVDTLTVVKNKVKRNEFLADILLKYGVSYQTIDNVVRKTKDVFDVRDIRRGHNYALILNNDSVPKALYFIYEQNPEQYVKYHLLDSIYALREYMPVKTQTDTTAGIIKTSLWNAIQDNNDDVNLAIKLSEIYAWTIDFFELKPNDSYKVIYNQRFVNGKYTGMGKILAADFIHEGQNYYAFYFEQNGKGNYFDETGKSLQRAFLKAPLKYTRISSRFSNRRWQPILKIYRPHHGVDYAAPTGTPVHALGDGVIIARGYQKMGAGNYLKIRHNSIYTTQYAHLSRYARGMRDGVRVKQDQVIGYVGMTGLATGPHLDFRVFKNGVAINPLKLKSPPSIPISKANMPAYDSLVKQYLPVLDSL
ncbi:MAG: peptidoglycan DD-metalloendopeptidase family protein [Bacteroidales bacterium]|nr:peptidoglycan DD-metalloendopeptidase family protein [Bacteroidales bacterium]